MVLANGHTKNHRIQQLFKNYQEKLAALQTFSAAHGRLEQVLTEHLSLSDLVHKVKNIAIGSSEYQNSARNTPKDPPSEIEASQQKTPPATRRPSLGQRRISLPVATGINASSSSEGLRPRR